MYTVGVSLPGNLPHVAIEVDTFEEAYSILEEDFVLDWDEDIEHLIAEDVEWEDRDYHWRDALDDLRIIAKQTDTQGFDYLHNGLVYYIHEHE